MDNNSQPEPQASGNSSMSTPHPDYTAIIGIGFLVMAVVIMSSAFYIVFSQAGKSSAVQPAVTEEAISDNRAQPVIASTTETASIEVVQADEVAPVNQVLAPLPTELSREVSTTLIVNDPPAAPIIKSIKVLADRVVIEWNDYSFNESGFEVHRAAGGKPWTIIGKVGANVTTFVDMAPVFNGINNYSIKSVNAFGTGNSGTSVINGPSGATSPSN